MFSLRLWLVVVILFGSGCADDLLLHPTTKIADAHGAHRRMIFTGRDQQVEVFTARSPAAEKSGDAQAFVLEFTGNATRAEYITRYVADRWGDRPVEVWAMNYPGFGQSTGPAKLKSIAPASLAVYDELAKSAAGKPIIIEASSLGTCAALYIATQRHVRGLVLQNPPPLQRMILQKYGWIVPSVVVAQIPVELNSLDNASKARSRAIFLTSGKDLTVFPEYQRMVVDAYAGEKHLIDMPDAGHNAQVKGKALEKLQNDLDWLWTAACGLALPVR
jgi:hypothetical protein